MSYPIAGDEIDNNHHIQIRSVANHSKAKKISMCTGRKVLCKLVQPNFCETDFQAKIFFMSYLIVVDDIDINNY